MTSIQNHGYALSFASGIVMVWTSPWAYNFNYAPHSSHYFHGRKLHILKCIAQVAFKLLLTFNNDKLFKITLLLRFTR